MKLNVEKKELLSGEAHALARELSAGILERGVSKDPERLARMFEQCFVNTVDTTVACLENGETFLITGDIEAMWLRDSSAQVVHYMDYLDRYPGLSQMVKGLIARQFTYINIDTYANAFNIEANGRCWEKDETDSNAWEWERKYEIDSLCYPVRLLWEYYKKTRDTSVFTPEVLKGLKRIVKTFQVEQHHEEQSPYFFIRRNCPPTDTLAGDGRGTPVAYTGMIWCGFRPSDDACTYGYLIPSNLFAAEILSYVAVIANRFYQDPKLEDDAEELREEVLAGVHNHGLVEHPVFGRIYAYEVDGLGNQILMDDANVPSLLSLPWLNCCDVTDPVYQNTRAFVLSDENPYYFSGKAAKGIGSPHTPDQYIWHIALSMQGLTSVDPVEREELLETLMATDAGTGYMHEGFHCEDPAQFTRPWFAWSNSLFSLFAEQFLA